MASNISAQSTSPINITGNEQTDSTVQASSDTPNPAQEQVERRHEDLPHEQILPRMQHCLSQHTTSRVSYGLYAVHVCLTIIYIFITSRETQSQELRIVRWVLAGMFLLNSITLCFLNPDLVIRHKLEVILTFMVIATILYYLIGGNTLTDGVGVIMASVVLSAVFPELKGDFMAMLGCGGGGTGGSGSILPV